jgi:hypothetical protein
MKHRKTFLGIGWKFPPTFDKRTGSVEMVSEEADIQESLQILLSTRKGERLAKPDFGCDLSILIFETIDATTLNYARQMIEYAILMFEPRITLEKIEIVPNPNEGIIHFKLDYTIRKTNTRSNMVYPFYLLEGTEVRIATE